MNLAQLPSEERAKYVSKMFSRISHRYDLLNGVMSFGRHHSWRKKAVGLAVDDQVGVALDIATGTGDMALDLLESPIIKKVVGLDFTSGMLRRGLTKASDRGVCYSFYPVVGDAHQVPCRNNSFVCATVGFGIRNFADVPSALSEILRVLKPAGKVVILEIVRPEGFIMSRLFPFYFRNVTPFMGLLLAGESEAYTYLPESVQEFMKPSELAVLMKEAQLSEVTVTTMALGSIAILSGRKPG